MRYEDLVSLEYPLSIMKSLFSNLTISSSTFHFLSSTLNSKSFNRLPIIDTSKRG